MEDESDGERVETDADLDLSELQKPQTVNKAQLRANLRSMVDLAAQSGLSPDEVQSIYREIADGVPYYYEDIQRYAANPDGE